MLTTVLVNSTYVSVFVVLVFMVLCLSTCVMSVYREGTGAQGEASEGGGRAWQQQVVVDFQKSSLSTVELTVS